MKILSFSFFLIIPTILLNGCFGEVNCPAFPDSELRWMPYKQGDSIKFSDGDDTIAFIFDESFKTEAYSFKRNCKCACEANAGIKSAVNTETDLKIEMFCNYYGDQTSWEFEFIRYGGDFYSAQRSDMFHFKQLYEDYEPVIFDTLTLNSVQYQNVAVLELDTLSAGNENHKKPEVWRIYIADSKGIIQFDDRSDKKTWTKL